MYCKRMQLHNYSYSVLVLRLTTQVAANDVHVLIVT